jgi:charged multivesicular body protein 7
LRALESKQFGQPLSLSVVLAEAVAKGEIIPVQTFEKSRESVYQKSWGSLAWSALGWGLRTAGVIGAPGSDGRMPKGEFAVLSNLETGAKAFAEKSKSRTSRFERTFSRAQFQRTFETSLLDGQTLSGRDFELLLRFLSRDKGVLVTDGHTVKMPGLDDEKSATITQEDAAIASLKDLIEDLTAQTEVLSNKVDELAASAKAAVLKKNRVVALAALKSKKMAEVNLTKRYATLNQLEDVAAKIEQAADNVQLVRVMEGSATALKSLNAKVGGADKVDQVLDDLREQMAEADEVGNIISEAGPAVDEEAVDEELEAMLAEEARKEGEVERAKEDAQQEREAEQTRRRLAELEKLGPVAAEVKDRKAEAATERKSPTPVTAAAGELENMSI